jgi:hypothetical protein
MSLGVACGRPPHHQKGRFWVDGKSEREAKELT